MLPKPSSLKLSGTSLHISVHSHPFQKFLREDAKHLRLNMKDYELKDMFSKCEEYVQRLRSLAIEVRDYHGGMHALI